MNTKDRTRRMFADALEKELKTKPLSKLKVTDLCRDCDTSTQLFYYYFHDKYELVSWIFLKDFLLNFGGKPADYSPEALRQIMLTMKRRRTFYQKAFADTSQNSIAAYIQRFNLHISEKAYEALHDGEKLSPNQILLLKYHFYGTMGLFVEWLDEKNTISAEQWANFQYDRTPDFIREAFAAYQFSSEEEDY